MKLINLVKNWCSRMAQESSFPAARTSSAPPANAIQSANKGWPPEAPGVAHVTGAATEAGWSIRESRPVCLTGLVLGALLQVETVLQSSCSGLYGQVKPCKHWALVGALERTASSGYIWAISMHALEPGCHLETPDDRTCHVEPIQSSCRQSLDVSGSLVSWKGKQKP
jgi:hypothetical protein